MLDVLNFKDRMKMINDYYYFSRGLKKEEEKEKEKKDKKQLTNKLSHDRIKLQKKRRE